ncbi:MAG: hypothetical protein GEU88_04735 [Solirubrobacterales bacterium]|nr:hypothetical protein [Solirubrobacterales bacterium]
MSEAVALEFQAPSGETVEVEWRSDRLAELEPTVGPGEPAWRLGGELDWDEVEALRAVSARLDDGRLLVLASLRPRGAAGNGEELTSGALGDDGGFQQLAETLLSVEYGADGEARRIGLELYPSADSIPVRIAGDATAAASSHEGGVERRSTAFALRSAGAGGAAILDRLSRG